MSIEELVYVTKADHEKNLSELKELRAEVERLRAAIRSVVDQVNDAPIIQDVAVVSLSAQEYEDLHKLAYNQ